MQSIITALETHEGNEVIAAFGALRLDLERRGLMVYSDEDELYRLLNATEYTLRDRLEAAAVNA